MTANDARRAHALLDGIINGHILGSKDVDHLRSFLPERPKQKTLEEICEDVALSLDKTSGDQWGDEAVYLESWLKELHAQLQGLKAAPVNAPALPDGMRIADHAVYGRVVVSPAVDDDGTCKIFYLSTHARDGSDSCWAPIDSLTFADGGTFRLSPPEFLETEADYQNAPEGTIVAIGEESPRMKYENVWPAYVNSIARNCDLSGTRRRVLRWGFGNE